MPQLIGRTSRPPKHDRPAFESLEPRMLLAATFYVSPRGDDANPGTDPLHAWRHIQKACDAATPGSTVTVLPGRYSEKLVINVSGNEAEGFITFQAGGKVIISGKKVKAAGQDMIFVNNRNYLRIIGFDIRDNLKVKNGSGIRLTESCSHIEIRNNRIHNVTGTSAMGITVYGTEPTRGISDVVIDGNEVFRCQPAPSEAIVLNGNVHGCSVTNNYVHDVNNIGIDVIGGEGRCPDPAADVTRDGVVSGNRVTRARFNGGGRDAAGIYVDGARNIVVERNLTWRNDVGIEVNAIHPSVVATAITVRDNYVSANNRCGISIGGSDAATGSVKDCRVVNNTLSRNDAKRAGGGEIRIQSASNNLIANNIVSARRGSTVVKAEPLAGPNTLNYNLYLSPAGPARARFVWRGVAHAGLAAYRTASGQDGNSLFADPQLARPAGPDLRLRPTSPAINAGDPASSVLDAETDIHGEPRLRGGRIDIGADEAA